MSAKVVTIYNRVPLEPYYRLDRFIESLMRLGVTPVILGFNKPWGGLMTKPRHLRQWLRDGGAKNDNIIVADAWDVVFAEQPETIMARKRELFGDAVVFNAEKSCFPRGDLADQFPDQGTPWRYLNSGFMAGSGDAILAILDSMKLDDIPDDHQLPNGAWFHPNDQEHYTLAYLSQPVPMKLDVRAELCQCCSGCEPSEFAMAELPIRNIATGAAPGVWHFNGGSKNILMPMVHRALGL